MGTAIGARISQLIDFEQVTISRQGTGMNVELPLKIAPADMDDLLSKLIPTSPSRMQIEARRRNGRRDSAHSFRVTSPRILPLWMRSCPHLGDPNHSDATTAKLSPSAVIAFDEFLSEEKEVAKYPEWFRDFRVHASLPFGAHSGL